VNKQLLQLIYHSVLTSLQWLFPAMSSSINDIYSK